MDFDKIQRDRHAEREAAFGERPFTFRGETFYAVANASYTAMKDIAGIDEADNRFQVWEKAALSMIDPRDDAHERFLTITRQAEFPVTLDDLLEVLNWLIQEQTNRPPTQQSSSSPSSEGNGTVSRETSSTEQAEALKA